MATNSIDNTLEHSTPGSGPMQIDLPAVLRKKLGAKRARWVPKLLVRGLEKAICADGLNALLRECHPREGADFARGVIEALGVNVEVSGKDRLPPAAERRVMLVSNHPMGGIEGLALIDLMSRRYGGNVYVMVNDILMAVEPLQGVFVPVNKHGSQSHASAERLEQVLSGDDPVLIFPAGLVSRLGADGAIADKTWRKTFVNAAIKYRRTVVPLYCDGRNSGFFYRFAQLRERLGIRLNIEMVCLPREVLRMRGKTLHIACGEPIAWSELRGGPEAQSTALEIRRRADALKDRH